MDDVISKLAIMRRVSPAINRCELTHLDRAVIDPATAQQQHDAYRQVLASRGWAVLELPAADDQPDCVFVEDTAVVMPDFAIACRPGAASRRTEASLMASILARFMPVHQIQAPATIDGGDVLVVGRDIFVGRTLRTNDAGIEQVRLITSARGDRVRPVETRDCLHLKTAVCAVGDDLLLANPDWVDIDLFDREVLTVSPDEPFAANVVDLGDAVIVPAHHPQMARSLRDRGHDVIPVPADELAKAEGGVTCCSLLIQRSW